MPHVQERFVVQGLVLDDAEGRFRPVEQRMPGTIEIATSERLLDLSVGVGRKRPDRRAGWPQRLGARCWPLRGRFVRVDAAREKILEPRVDARTAQRLLDEGVEAEARQVPLVEHDRMAQRNRLAVVRLVREQVEQLARPCAAVSVPVERLTL